MLLKQLVKVSVPAKVENKVTLTGFHVVKAHVVFDSNFVEHVMHRHLAGERQRTVHSAVVVAAKVAVLAVARGVLHL